MSKPELIPLENPDGTPVMGKRTRRVLTESQVRRLIEARQIELIGRRVVKAARLKAGVTIHVALATLRSGVKAQLPIAEDNRTVRRVLDSGVTYYEHDHVEAWDDGRFGKMA